MEAVSVSAMVCMGQHTAVHSRFPVALLCAWLCMQTVCTCVHVCVWRVYGMFLPCGLSLRVFKQAAKECCEAVELLALVKVLLLSCRQLARHTSTKLAAPSSWFAGQRGAEGVLRGSLICTPIMGMRCLQQATQRPALCLVLLYVHRRRVLHLCH